MKRIITDTVKESKGRGRHPSSNMTLLSENSIDNTSDHLSIKLQLNYCNIFGTFSADDNLFNNSSRYKIKWGKISENEIESCYTIRLIMTFLL